MRKRLEFIAGNSSKFWEIEQTGSDLTITFGRIGTAGQTQYRSFASPAAAAADGAKQVATKIRKGYHAVAAKAAGRTGQAKTPTIGRGPSANDSAFPFLFVGQGVASSYKCLECYLWFERPPNAKQRARIKAELPLPVAAFATFHGDLLHFGSHDDLEFRVKAAYEPPFATKPFKQASREVFAIAKAAEFSEDVLFPKPRYWRAFCEDFERKMLAVHAIANLKLALKPDNEGEPLRAGAWHRWSIAHLDRVVDELARHRKPTVVLAYLTVNLLDDVPTKMTPIARKAWLAWLDKLRAFDRPQALADDDVWDDFSVAIFDGVPKREREEVLGALSKSMQRLLKKAAD